MLWRRCVTRGGLIGLVVGLVAGGLLTWWQGPSTALLQYVLWLTGLTTISGGVTGLVTLMWLRGAAQTGAKISGVRAGVVSGLFAGAIVGGGAALLGGLLGGAIFAGIASAATAGVTTGALTAVTGAPLGCSVKGWIEGE
jgi:hypothetical protein